MAKVDYLQRYLLIYNKLINQKQSLEQLFKYLNNQSDSVFHVSERTIQRDIKELGLFFNVVIVFNRKEKYYELDETDIDESKRRTIESFELYNSLQYSSKIGNKIILENRNRSGVELIHGILHAIENKLEICFNHQSYWKEKTFRTVQPISIKEIQQRWYLICYDVAKKEIRNFSLDRILDLKITDQRFTPKKFDATKFYESAFGIETYNPAEKIVLRFTNFQAQYIKSLPIHHSQKIIAEDDNHTHFEYFMHPTHDLVMEILKYSDTVKVLQPDSLRETVKTKIENTLGLYQ
ncbi:MAG: WYL domain-containing protein [Flavobacterium sp.]|nr:WYL domain-containing protein [Flavobacterium sp.]